MAQPLEERFFDKVMKAENGCWLWIGSISKNGYGAIFANGRQQSAHRLSYELAHGSIPDHESYHGMCVLHKCDVRNCVNPDHLFLGTNADNMTDKMAKGRGGHEYRVMTKGEKNHTAKLTEDDVIKIRASDKTVHELARECGVDKSTIYSIKARKIWRHVK